LGDGDVVVEDGGVDGGGELLTEDELSLHGGQGVEVSLGDSLDEDDVGCPELFDSKSEGPDDGHVGGLGGGGESFEDGVDGIGPSQTGQGLESLIAIELVGDLGKLEDGLGDFSSSDLCPKARGDRPCSGNCEGSGDDQEEFLGNTVQGRIDILNYRTFTFYGSVFQHFRLYLPHVTPAVLPNQKCDFLPVRASSTAGN
jgi:hypothetical protein